jgi:hypothetical protein
MGRLEPPKKVTPIFRDEPGHLRRAGFGEVRLVAVDVDVLRGGLTDHVEVLHAARVQVVD